MKAKCWRSVIVVLSLIVLYGCATARAGEAPGRHASLPPPASSGRLRTPQHLANAGIDLAVPPSSASPSLSAAQALALCSTGDPICVPGKAPTIQLAVATVYGSGRATSSGPLVPSIVDVLAYVMTWTGVPCLPAGGVPGASPAPVQSCTVISLIDAGSGKVLYSYQGTNP